MYEDIAAKIHRAATAKNKIAMFHLQVLANAKDLIAIDPKEFCRLVEVPVSYATEFHKMLHLARLMDAEGVEICPSSTARQTLDAQGDFVFQLRIVAQDPEQPMLDEVSLFLFHLDALYSLSRIVVEPQLLKLGSVLAPYYWHPLLYSSENPILSRSERLQLRILSKHSPLEVVATVVAIAAGTGAAFGAFVQGCEKISNWKLNKEKLSAEVRKACEEAAKAHAECTKSQTDTKASIRENRILSDKEIMEALNKGPVNQAIDFHLSELDRLPFRPTDIEIKVVRIHLEERKQE